MEITVRREASMMTVLVRSLAWVYAATGAILVLSTPSSGALAVLIVLAAGLMGYVGTWSLWTLTPGAISGEAIDEDAEVLVFHGPEGSNVWFCGHELKRDLEPFEALAFARSVGGAVDREVRVFSSRLEHTAFIAAYLRDHRKRLPPEVFANVLPCAPRRQVSLDQMTCFIGDRTLTLGAHGVRFGDVELAYDEIFEVFTVPFHDQVMLVFLTEGQVHELRVGVPVDSRSARYQWVVGEARWLEAQVRARLDDQPVGEVPAALSTLRERSA